MMVSQSSQQTISRTLIVFVMAVWFVLVLVGSLSGVFIGGPSQPPIGIGIAFLLPIVLFLGAWYGSGRVQRFVASLRLEPLILLQATRLFAIVFFIEYFLGYLPGTFAIPGGVGDIAIALTAPLMVWMLGTRIRSRFNILLLWNTLGLLDLIMAVSLGVLTSDSTLGFLAGPVTSAPLTVLPLSLIPTFLVPFDIILHLITFARLNQVRQGLSA